LFAIPRIGRRPHIDAANSQRPRPGVASAPPSEPSTTTIGRHARTCRPAARNRHAPHAAPDGDKVRAPNDPRLHPAIMPHVPFGEKPMTAYLISLALAGLVVIAVSEGFS